MTTAVYPSYAEVPSPHTWQPFDELTLVALTSAQRLAGLFAKRTAVGWGLRPVADAAERVAVELIARAVETTGNPDPHPRYTQLLNPPPLIGIRITGARPVLLVEVWDSDPTSPLPTDNAYLDRHLTAVHDISQRWNWYTRCGGKIIWVELAIPQPRHTGRQLPQHKPGVNSYGHGESAATGI